MTNKELAMRFQYVSSLRHQPISQVAEIGAIEEIPLPSKWILIGTIIGLMFAYRYKKKK